MAVTDGEMSELIYFGKQRNGKEMIYGLQLKIGCAVKYFQ